MSQRVLVVGAGAWGTALAVHCARAGHEVLLWARNPAAVGQRLPGIALPETVRVTGAMPDGGVAAAVMAVPVQHLRGVLALGVPAVPLVLCMKGLEAGTRLLPGEVAAGRPFGVLTGPNFAHELAAGLPAAAVMACGDEALRSALVRLIGTRGYRLYGSADVLGAQVGGAAKNVIAIAAGIAIGAGLGENARAALVTRGVAELGRVILALGGRPETASGLSGLGDLMLTCSGGSSRNFRLGLAIGQGVAPGAARDAIGAAVEGVEAAPALLARVGGEVDCPIVAAVSDVLAGRMDVAAAMGALLDRAWREE